MFNGLEGFPMLSSLALALSAFFFSSFSFNFFSFASDALSFLSLERLYLLFEVPATDFDLFFASPVFPLETDLSPCLPPLAADLSLL